MNTRTTTRLALTASMLLPAALVTQRAAAHGEEPHERFLYVSTIAQSDSDPDFVAVIGADPEQSDFGEIVNRVDMPNVGDELHHFGYSADQQRLIVPGLFSNRIHVFDVDSDGSTMTLERGERGPRRRQRVRRSPRRDGDARHGPGADDRGGQRSDPARRHRRDRRPHRRVRRLLRSRAGTGCDRLRPHLHVRLRHDARR